MAFEQWISEGNLRSAGNWLVQTYAAEVLGLCRSFVDDLAQAEDLAQDTFGKAFGGLAEFRGEASPRTWLLKIARNRCIDHLRAQGRRITLVSDDPNLLDHAVAETPLPADLSSRRDEVDQALIALNEGERALVILRFAHGLSYEELAATFGIRSGTARMRVSRALTKMRDELKRSAIPAMPAGRAAPGPAAAAPPPAAMPAAISSLGPPELGDASSADSPSAPGSAKPPARRRRSISTTRIPDPVSRGGIPSLRMRPHALIEFFHETHTSSSDLDGRLADLAAGLPG